MWEWSNNKKASASKENTSLQKAYASYIPLPTITREENTIQTPSILQMEDVLQQKILTFGIKNISLRLVNFQPLSWEKKHEYQEEQVRNRKIFLKLMGYSHPDLCLAAGMNADDILLLKQSISPENYNVHIKVPFDFGGEPTLDNLCLLRTHPLHDKLHELLEFQLEQNFLKQYKKLYIPQIEELVKNA